MIKTFINLPLKHWDRYCLSKFWPLRSYNFFFIHVKLENVSFVFRCIIFKILHVINKSHLREHFSSKYKSRCKKFKNYSKIKIKKVKKSKNNFWKWCWNLVVVHNHGNALLGLLDLDVKWPFHSIQFKDLFPIISFTDIKVSQAALEIKKKSECKLNSNWVEGLDPSGGNF